MRFMSKRAQSTGEYAILFAIVLGAVIAIQNFVRNRIAQRIMTQANVYNPAAAPLQTSSNQTSFTTAAMTEASKGVVGSQSAGTSATQSP